VNQRELIALVAIFAVGCGGSRDETVFTKEDWVLLRGMAFSPSTTSPLDVGNEFVRLGDAGAIEVLGQQLFFDTELSAKRADGGGVSCAECHAPTDWFSDARGENNVSYGVDWTGRNSPSLVNVGFYSWFAWDGRADMLWVQGKHAYESSATMAGTPLHLAQQVARRYGTQYLGVFHENPPQGLLNSDAGIPDQDLDRVYRNVLKAWGAYLLQLNSGDSPFDAFVNGDESALTPEQLRGLHLFIGKAGCINCHSGQHFTDNKFHALGLEQNGVHVPGTDPGRSTGLTKLAELDAGAGWRLFPVPARTPETVGQFRTKSLRHVSQTAPYFHAGQMATLADVVWFYNQGGLSGVTNKSPFIVPLGLTEAEQAELVAFLGSLTGKPVPARWACNNAQTEGGVGPRCTP
jgi:cytochrome c peroxidase